MKKPRVFKIEKGIMRDEENRQIMKLVDELEGEITVDGEFKEMLPHGDIFDGNVVGYLEGAINNALRTPTRETANNILRSALTNVAEWRKEFFSK